EVEADPLQRVQADLGRLLLRVRALERREPADPCHVEALRALVALRAEQAVEPALAQLPERLVRDRARVGEHRRELAERDVLLLLVARDGIRLARQLRR